MASGLRGAVSLTLSLIVVLNPRIAPETGYLVAFHVSGIVLLTTLVNGTVTEAIYRILNISAPSVHDDDLALSIFRDIEYNYIDVAIEKLEKQWFYRNARFNVALNGVPDLSLINIIHGKVFFGDSANGQRLRDAVEKHDSTKRLKIQTSSTPIQTEHGENETYLTPRDLGVKKYRGSFFAENLFEKDDLLEDISLLEEKLRFGFINAVKANYDLQYERGYIRFDSLVILRNAADFGIERYAHIYSIFQHIIIADLRTGNTSQGTQILSPLQKLLGFSGKV